MYSNTRMYEEQRGWRGVLVEPNREEFEKIPSTRPEAIAVHAAICDQAQDVHFISSRPARPRECGCAVSLLPNPGMSMSRGRFNCLCWETSLLLASELVFACHRTSRRRVGEYWELSQPSIPEKVTVICMIPGGDHGHHWTGGH